MFALDTHVISELRHGIRIEVQQVVQ